MTPEEILVKLDLVEIRIQDLQHDLNNALMVKSALLEILERLESTTE